MSLLDRPLVPIANADDARTTARALSPYLGDGRPHVLYVVEKAGGAPDKAGVEQREEEAGKAFDAFADELGREVETEVRYATEVPEAVFEAARETEATSVAFVPRAGGRIVRALSGDIALTLVTENDIPVVSLPTDE
jgi:nucleotide-binding universal stress UspA family protein